MTKKEYRFQEKREVALEKQSTFILFSLFIYLFEQYSLKPWIKLETIYKLKHYYEKDSFYIQTQKESCSEAEDNHSVREINQN